MAWFPDVSDDRIAPSVKRSLLPWLALFGLFQPLEARGEDVTAKALVDRVLETRAVSSGFVLRAKLSVSDSVSGTREAAQIRIKGSRSDQGMRLLYQVLWPPAHKGETLYLESSDDGGVTGYLFAPTDKTQPVTPSLLGTPFLESDLTIEDLAGDFWHWPKPFLTGKEIVRGIPCMVVELRAPPESRSSYSKIRAWISYEKSLPMQLLKFGRDGNPLNRIVVTKLARNGELWAPVITSVQAVRQTRETTLELSGGDYGIDIPASDFSLEEIKKFALTPGSPLPHRSKE